ncbi:DinB family protein [Fictibacillus phosphorivorans]|uniref:DinB family protein n=1 Tax=Fictibacillus phosphorivorans TaxID=1221500 RepID=UPI001E3F96F6|nr:DinB family protein [Fictibacillus phosphorivorans]
MLMEYRSFANWMDKLKEVPEEIWLHPIKDDKWSIGEMLAHIKAWDIFVWDERFSYFVDGSSLPPQKVDVEEINRNAANDAKSGISKTELIDEVIECRLVLSKKLEEMQREIWEKKIQMGNSEITLCEYIKGMVEHDQHHKIQIENFLISKGIKLIDQVV